MKNLEILNFFKELKILIDDFFFESNLRSTSPMPLVPRPFLKISFFFFFFFENFVNLEFFHGIEIFYWWFFFEKFRNLEFFQGIENFEFFFWKKPKKYESNAPSPKAFFENFVFFFFFFEIWRFVHYQKSEEDEDEDEDGVKVMKIYSWWFFFFFFLKNLEFFKGI